MIGKTLRNGLIAAAIAVSSTVLAQDSDAPTKNDGLYRAPPDQTLEDNALAEGTIRVTLVDPNDNPLPGTTVTLGVLQNSVAKGESRKHLTQPTDPAGDAFFRGLELGNGFAYRVSVAKEGATFAATPFVLGKSRGTHVILHVFPVTHDIKQAVVFFQGALFVDVKDDRVQIQQAFRVSNYGPVAWVPENLTIDLPEGNSAFNASQEMSDQGWDSTAKGCKLRGTFPAGEADIGYSWQLPYSGEPTVSFEVMLPPHMASLVVRAAASQQMKLEVEGFPAADPDQDEQGNHLLVTGKQVKPEDPQLKRVKVTVRDLPTPGPGRWIATALAAMGVAIGLGMVTQSGQKKLAGKGARAALLEELVQLELAHAAGDVGPKTYERARRELIDGLARWLADNPKLSPALRS